MATARHAQRSPPPGWQREMMLASIDHLVVACADLELGEAWVRERLGVPAQPGGKHLLMGTHNRLLKLGPRVYLELIALDPDVPAQRPRWFGLDSEAVRERISHGPFVLTWVASCTDLPAAAARLPQLGEVVAARRGEFSWRITLPADGHLNFDGVLPTLIQWDGTAHPCDGLEATPCTLFELQLSHPQAATIRAAFEILQIGPPVHLGTGDVAIVARVRSPRGIVELR